MKQSKMNAFVLGVIILLITLQPALAQHDSENCTLIGRWPNGSCNTTFVVGNYAYVVDRSSGLHIIDIGTPASPIEVGSFDTENSVYDVYIQNNYAYIANGIDGLRILDISTPSSPVEVGICNIEVATSVYVLDNYAYVTSWSPSFRIIDVSTPASPVEIGSFDTEDEAISVCVVNNYAYLIEADSGLRIIDVSAPFSPTEVGFYNTGDIAAGIYADNNYVYVADGEDGLYILQFEPELEPPIIRVPAEYSTITEAMVVANYGDTILVAPGTYPESIIMEAGVVLLSETGPKQTIISRNEVSQLITGAQDAVIKGFTIADNDNGPAQAGNGIYSDGDNVTICYCIIRNNRGGIYIDNNSQALVYNNTIDNNSLAGIYMQIEPSPEIYNNIITSNGENGIFRNTGHSLGDPFIQYNCYHGNGVDYGYYGTPWTPEPGAGELFENPLFIGGSPFDYHLSEDSPCIDKGDPSSPLDPDGTRADIGALYYDQSTGVDLKHTVNKPRDFYMYPAYPNPFNSGTTIFYQLPKSIKVNISIYNLLGNKVKVLESRLQRAGSHIIQWDGKDKHGISVTSGIYICCLQSGEFRQSIKLMLVR